MTRHPFYNALAALVYIILVVGFIRLVGYLAGDTPDNDFLAPLAAISLLTLSVAVMAYVFFYTPLLLIVRGEQQTALRLFLKTIAMFAALTLTVFGALLVLL